MMQYIGTVALSVASSASWGSQYGSPSTVCRSPHIPKNKEEEKEDQNRIQNQIDPGMIVLGETDNWSSVIEKAPSQK